MAATAPVKNYPLWKNRWLKVILQKKSVRSKKRMDGRYSSLQIKWHTTLKNGRLQVVLIKIDIVFTKMWCFRLILFNSSCSQKLQYPERKLRLYVLWKSNSLEKVVVPKVPLASANVCNCSSKKFTILNSCNCCC